MDKTKLNLERLRAYDAEWDENKHPRAENEQFTSGSGSAGGSANGSSESSAKSHNSATEPKSPLRQTAETIQGGSGKAAKKADEPAFDFSVEKPANMSKGFFYDVYKLEILSERLHENISKQKYDDVNDYVDSLKSKGFNVSEPKECGYKQYKVNVVYHDDYTGEDVRLITYYRGRSKEAGTPAGGFYR